MFMVVKIEANKQSWIIRWWISLGSQPGARVGCQSGWVSLGGQHRGVSPRDQIVPEVQPIDILFPICAQLSW